MQAQIIPSRGRNAFWVPGSNLAPTAAGDLVVVEAGASKETLVHGIWILQPGIQTTAAVVKLQLLRKTTAGTGGVVTPNPFDSDDAAFSGICRAAPSPSGADGVVLSEIPIFVPTAIAGFVPYFINLESLLCKFPRIKAGVTNGMALKHPGAAGAAGFYAALEISES